MLTLSIFSIAIPSYGLISFIILDYIVNFVLIYNCNKNYSKSRTTSIIETFGMSIPNFISYFNKTRN